VSTTVNRTELVAALRALRPLATRTTLPVLANVHIEAEEKHQLSLVTTNLEQYAKRYVAFEGDSFEAITVPAKAFSDFAAGFSGDTIDLTLDGNKLRLKFGRQKASLGITPAEEFPAFATQDSAHSFTLTRDEFDRNVSRVTGFAANDTARPILTGVSVVGDGEQIRFAAADNYRIGVATVDHPAKIEAVFPAIAFTHASKVLEGDHVSVTVDGRTAMFASTKGTLVTRLIEGQYPNILPVLPTDFKATVLVSQEELEQAAKLSGVVSNGANIVQFEETNEGLRLHTRDDTTDFDMTLEATYGAGKDGNVNIALNQKYVQAVAVVLGDSTLVELGWNGPLQPIAFRDPDDLTFRAVIMPVRTAS